MKYGKYWFHLQKKILLQIFSFKDYLCLKNKFRAIKKIPSVTRRCRCLPGVGRNLCRRYLSRLKGYRFVISAIFRHLGWIDAPHTQNFEILKSLEQTQESKNSKIVFEIFVKMLDGCNFGRRCLLGCPIWLFSELQNFDISLKKIEI
jgi:hypothetical protein